jgi:hypothetical protein
VPSMAKRFPVLGARKRTQWTIYNLSRDGSADVLIGSLDVASVEGGLSATT